MIGQPISELRKLTVDTYGMIVIAFLVIDKANHIKFFEETFLLANVSLEIVFSIFFLTLSETNFDLLD